MGGMCTNKFINFGAMLIFTLLCEPVESESAHHLTTGSRGRLCSFVGTAVDVCKPGLPEGLQDRVKHAAYAPCVKDDMSTRYP